MYKYLFPVLGALCLLTGGCQQTAMPDHQTLAFTGTPYVLNVANTTVVDEYESSKTPPNVELLSDIAPAEAVRQWATSKLAAGGSTGYGEVVIKDAHIVKKILPKQKSGVEGYFTAEQTEQYDGRLEVEIKLYDGKKTLPVAVVQASAQNSRTLPENATIADRNAVYHDMSVELMQLMEKELDNNIHAHFGNYLM